MEHLSRVVNITTEWTQPKTMTRHFELGDGTRTFATLTFEKTFGSLGRASTADGNFSLKRVGFFNPHITARTEGAEEDVATYHPRWTGSSGEFHFPGGRNYFLKTANFWATRHEVSDAGGRIVITLQRGVEDSHLTDMFKSQARMDIDVSMRDNPDLPVLVLMLWYILILQQSDHAGTAATMPS